MTTRTFTLSEFQGTRMNAIKTALALLVVACTLTLFRPAPVQAQPSGDALTSIDAIMRFMASENFDEEDLKRRIVWSEKLVNEVVAYAPTDENRQNYVRLLDIGLKQFQDENSRLRVLVRAITTLDPLIQKYFPQWIVMDEPTVLEIMRKVRDNRDDLRDDEAVEIADRILTGRARIRIIRSPRDPETLIAVIIEKARARGGEEESSASFSANAENPDFEDYRIVGKKNLRDVLTSELYDRVANPSEYPHRVETGVLQPRPDNAEATVSIPFGGGFMWTLETDNPMNNNVGLAPSRIRAGFELKIGNDWVNLPFLYGPQWNTMFVYEPSSTEYFKLGPSIPFTWGDESINTDLPLLKNRRTNGTWGVSGEYFRQLSNTSAPLGTDAYGLGAAAFVSFGLNKFGTKKVTNADGEILNGTGMKPFFRDHEFNPPVNAAGNPDKAMLRRLTFYYMTASATAYYWRDLGFMLDGLRLHVGLGYQKFNEARRTWRWKEDNTLFSDSTVFDSVKVLAGHGTLDAFVRLSYDHRGKTRYGTALQYFNGGLMAEVYFHIFQWLRAEVKYSRVVFRDPEPWEHGEMIVPGLRMNFVF
ncbi:MAG: hypothetical protein HY962_11635 [Ignavibacteriae bacterium]|nr:hypothetical protein [Ignavibacteriota bacterium]